MATDRTDGILYRAYRSRIGEPDTHDEVRGYWVFLTGLVLGILGMGSFLVSEPPQGAAFSIREVSIVLTAIGLSMLVAGFVIRLPLQSWANYAAYLGEVVCFGAAAWFVTIYPTGWSVQTGSQPVIVLYSVGLLLIGVGGLFAPLLAGDTREQLDASEDESADLRSKINALRTERDHLAGELEEAREGEAAGTAELESLRASQAQFELYEDRGGQYRWRLRHRNGNVIADGGQGYTRKHNAQKGIASVKRNALGGNVLFIEPDPDETPDEALESAPVLAEAVEDSQAEFEIYEDEAGESRWRLVHRNGNIIADGGEGYASRQGATDGIESVKNNAGPADYLRFDPASFEVYRDAAGEWRWRFVHKNGNILAAASEGYTRRRDAKRSVDQIREDVADAEDRFDVYEDNKGEYRWRFRAGNNEIVATSGEGYNEEHEAEAAAERVRTYAPDADALDVWFAAFEVYEDESEEWRWRLRHRNGNIIADSGEGYAERTGAHDAIESVKRNAPGAETTGV